MSDAAIALNRFGMGARPGDAVSSDPRAWLRDQLRTFDPRPAGFDRLPSQADIAAGIAEYRQELRSVARSQGDQPPGEPGPRQALRRDARQDARGQYLLQVGARTRAALASEAPFVERLVHFWANHFAVSIDKQAVTGLAGTLEFDAIRPHVLGSFADLLIAVEQHPAMLLYLDQAQSVGPASPLGTRAAARGARRAGLNENLAREIMELHTLGVRTGYSQADVTEFARALTGWTIAGMGRGAGAGMADDGDAPGGFLFAARRHEPGTRTIMGRSYSQRGEGQARAVLDDLAQHPATARHVATKLARHFVADDPPPALVDRLAQAFATGNGDLPTLYAALIDAPESWTAGQPKFKTPWEWHVSALRGLGVRTIGDQPAANLMVQLGQPVWRPGSPAGYDDIAASWAGSEALIKRVEVAERLAQRQGTDVDARALAAALLPGTLSPATAEAIARADSPGQGLALLLVSPEFLRR